MKMAILDALLALDVGNDEHWTADGLPRMDAVEALTGEKGITRQQVTAAKPGFSRAIAITAQEEGEGELEQESGGEPATDAPEEAEQEQVEDAGQPEAAAAKKALTKAQAELEKLRKVSLEAEAKFAAKSKEVDRLLAENEKIDAETGANSTSAAIRGYLNQQQKNLQERARRIRAIQESGVDLTNLTRGLKAPIDSAMKRDTGRGRKRPGAK